MIVRLLERLKNRTFALHFARPEIAAWTAEHLKRVGATEARVLDIGLGAGNDLLGVRRHCAPLGVALELYGIESQEWCVRKANAEGIRTYSINIEQERIPAPDGYFDVVMANHVIEHAKELFWMFAEIARVLKPGGMAIIGCPNLGSWHNRVALLFGQQPPCMKLLGPHVRGITKPAFKQFIEYGGFFELVRVKGSNFYPLPSPLNEGFAKLLPTLAASVHFVMRRTAKQGSFLEALDTPIAGITDTPYFRGPAAVVEPQRPAAERIPARSELAGSPALASSAV